jgi:trehalose 6-phosphate synthase/phosphatase
MSVNNKVLIVSNRLPVVMENVDGRVRAEPASGGLVTALSAVLKKKETIWVGWPGPGAEDREARELIQDAARENCRLVPVFLTSEEQAKFYYGFSNEIVWPLFHDLQSRCNFDPCYWNTYRYVNRKFAETVRKHAHETSCVWAHDYHLLLLADELRTLGIRKTLAYFHHIPFPSPDIYAKLPWRSELLRAMLSFDVVGFQTGRDLQNFVRCLRRFLASDVRVSASAREATIETREGRVFAGVFPISIDFQGIASRAASAPVTTMASSLRQNMNVEHLLLGVDRLDYTKGIPERLRAFALLLEKSRELRGRIAMAQVVVPSREDIPKYQELRVEVERLVTSINGRFSHNGWVPIHYVYRHLNQTELLAYYRAATVALVTPLRDGMNLVAKEFCAAQTDNDGALILSEFAGSAAQLKNGALLVNPNDMEGVAGAIRRAIMLSRQERLLRMRSLRRSIAKDNVDTWAEMFWRTVDWIAALDPEPVECAASA